MYLNKIKIFNTEIFNSTKLSSLLRPQTSILFLEFCIFFLHCLQFFSIALQQFLALIIHLTQRLGAFWRVLCACGLGLGVCGGSLVVVVAIELIFPLLTAKGDPQLLLPDVVFALETIQCTCQWLFRERTFEGIGLWWETSVFLRLEFTGGHWVRGDLGTRVSRGHADRVYGGLSRQFSIAFEL